MKLTKKEQLEKSAQELFWKYGFKKISIEEICKQAGVSRKTFYTFYDNKTALASEILNKLMDDAFKVYGDLLNGDAPFHQKIDSMFSYKYYMVEHLSKEFITDFYHPDSAELLQQFNVMIQRAMDMMRKFFSDSQKKGEINPELDLDYVMWLMQKFSEIFSSSEFLEKFPDVEKMTRQVTQTMMYGLMKVPETTNSDSCESAL
jgi:AcrR family transcriptional regulator